MDQLLAMLRNETTRINDETTRINANQKKNRAVNKVEDETSLSAHKAARKTAKKARNAVDEGGQGPDGAGHEHVHVMTMKHVHVITMNMCSS